LDGQSERDSVMVKGAFAFVFSLSERSAWARARRTGCL
jgi:hypothetical protein